MAYEPRFYRDYHHNEHQLKFNVCVDETDLLIVMDEVTEKDKLIDMITDFVKEIRQIILEYSSHLPEFLTSLEPISNNEKNRVDILDKIDRNTEFGNKVIKEMIQESLTASVGPMATVAGVTSQLVVEGMMDIYGNINIIVENGGDIYMNATDGIRKISIYAGESTLSNRLALKIEAEDTPLAICTSSGKIGHSLSFGKADAMVVVSKNAALADGMATGLCNQLKKAEDLNRVLSQAGEIKDIIGVLGIIDDKIGVWGSLELIKN